MTSPNVRVRTQSRDYDIVIGQGALGDPLSWKGLGRDAVALVVTNSRVGPLYAEALTNILRPQFASIKTIELADGEAHKDWASVAKIVDALLEMGADRRCLLFALGGGVVGDLTGFAAACYMRGVDYVQVPTTLLAQVDSSVGGKTAINHPTAKNIVGAFHQPIRVVADPQTLASLPQREVVAGVAEVIKYGAVADAELLGWIEQNLGALFARDAGALAYAVRRSCELKAEIVAADEKESGLRAILNFGHTFGHAIEAGAGYGVWLHGEAVGCGMAMGAELSRRMGTASHAEATRIKDLVRAAGLPVRAPAFGVDRYLELMRSDKKTLGGNSRFVLLRGLGAAQLESVPVGLLTEVLRTFGA